MPIRLTEAVQRMRDEAFMRMFRRRHPALRFLPLPLAKALRRQAKKARRG